MLRLPNLGRLTLHPLLSTGAGEKRPSNAAGKLPAKRPKNTRQAINDWLQTFFSSNDEELVELVVEDLKENWPGLLVKDSDGGLGLGLNWLAKKLGKSLLDPEVLEKCLKILRDTKKRVENERSKAAGSGPKKVKPALTEAQKEKQQKQKQATKGKQHAVDRGEEGETYFRGYMGQLKAPPDASAELLSELQKKWPEDHQLQTRRDDDGRGCCATRQDL